jgi:tetratricopeptide (TPR) repeat protein
MSADADVDDLLERAQALHDIERYQEALAVLYRALAAQPDNVEVLCWIAMTHFRRGEWAETLEFANRAVAADPEEEHGHRLRSCTLEQLGRLPEAVQAAEESVRLSPEGRLPLAQLVDSLAACERWEEALDAANRLIEIAPDSALAFWKRARVHLQREQWREAETYARRALAVDPEYRYALSGLGRALCQQGRRPEGMAVLYRALQLDPTNQWTQQVLLGEIDRYGFGSLDEFLRAQTDPDTMERAGRRGELKEQARQQIDRQRAREAIPPLLQALGTAPEDLGLLALLATAYTNSGNYQAAVEITDRMIRLAPDDARGHWRRAMALYLMSAFKTHGRIRLEGEALCSAEAAARISPEEPRYLFSLAALQLQRGLHPEAEQTAKRLLKLAPDWESSHLIMARIYSACRRWILTELYLRQALALSPKDQAAMGMLARSLWQQGKRLEAAVCFTDAVRVAFRAQP